MTKLELANKLAERCDLNPTRARRVIDAITAAIIEALVRGEEVEIRGFGVFGFRRHGPQQRWSPKTMEKFDKPAQKFPKFKASEGLKKSVNR